MTSNNKPYEYLFGPVPSRRLGLSLGVDLVPYKTCSFNCVFCQIGRTPSTVIDRREYVMTEAVIGELERWIGSGEKADSITLAGSGEPTLHTRFGEVIDTVHEFNGPPTTILSNGSLFFMPEVRNQARRSDTVKVSLSAPDGATFSKLNRPFGDIVFDKVVDGLRIFRTEFDGRLWLEVFVVKGINDTVEQMKRIADLANDIRPNMIHLNTVVRPPAEQDAQAAQKDQLVEYSTLFNPIAEVVAEFTGEQKIKHETTPAELLAILDRRPCTAVDLSESLGIDLPEIVRNIDLLLANKSVEPEDRSGKTFFVPAKHR